MSRLFRVVSSMLSFLKPVVPKMSTDTEGSSTKQLNGLSSNHKEAASVVGTISAGPVSEDTSDLLNDLTKSNGVGSKPQPTVVPIRVVSVRQSRRGQNIIPLQPQDPEELEAWINPPPIPPTAKDSLGPRRVRVSGRKIHFPRRCPCCLERPDTTLRVRFVRTEGDRIVKTAKEAWDVPYCQACMEIMLADGKLRRRFAQQQYLFPMVGVGLAVLILVVNSLFPTLIGMPVTSSATPSWLLVLLPAGGWVLAWLWNWFQTSWLLAQAPSSCASTRPAVEIIDTTETQTEFVFTHSTYAEEFARANSRRLVES